MGDDRESRARLEAMQHEVRALERELNAGESPEFAAKRAMLQAEAALLESRAEALGQKVELSEARVIDVQKVATAVESKLHAGQQRDLPILLAVLALGGVAISLPRLVSLPAEFVAASSGLGTGWLLAGHLIGWWSSPRGERVVQAGATQPTVLGIAMPLLMLLFSPALDAMQARSDRVEGFEALLRVSAGTIFVVLAGVASRLERRGVMLAIAMPLVGVASGLVATWSWSAQLAHNAADERVAAVIGSAALPVIFAIFWAMRSLRGNFVLALIASVLLAGASWANWWLALCFFQEFTFRFTLFAGLGLELSAAAWFLSLELLPGVTRRILLALCGVIGGWTAFVFIALGVSRQLFF